MSLFCKQIRIVFQISMWKKKMFQFSTWQMLKNISAKILSYFSPWPENSIFQIKFGTPSCSLIINDFIMRLYNQPMNILSLSLNSLWKKSICTKLSNKVILTSQTNKNQTDRINNEICRFWPLKKSHTYHCYDWVLVIVSPDQLSPQVLAGIHSFLCRIWGTEIEVSSVCIFTLLK